MASGYTPAWKRQLFRVAPALFWVCPGGNKHWRWDVRICKCRHREHSSGWHGGIWVDGVEMIPVDDLSLNDADHDADV